MNELKYKKAFTLVELIIVITILVILATIAFVSFQNYTKDSRDANRLTTINNISKGLDIFQIKTGFYPEPESKTSFTGAGDKKLHQGIISDNITNIINLSEIPFDPKEKTNYIYSTYSDGKYYQIASEAENITSLLYNTTYAENKSSIVKGNYKFDPSLPSLVVIPNSLTGSSIFDTKVCFVTNGGLNSITSNSGSCLKKEDMSLNTIDSGLVGYWDMESLDGIMLKDLSGNGNNGTCYNGASSGSCITSSPTKTGSIMGNGMDFNASLYQGIIMNKLSGFYSSGQINENVTISSLIKFKNQTFLNPHIFRLNGGGGGMVLGNTGTTFSITPSGSQWSEYKNNFLNGEYYYLVAVLNNDYILTYINGKLVYKIKRNEKNNMRDIAVTCTSPSTPWAYGCASIGNTHWNLPHTTGSFNGIIDELKIYNRALSDEEIAQQARISGF